MHRSTTTVSGLALGLVFACAGCDAGPPGPARDQDPPAKIRFDLDAIDPNGLIGPPGGLRALSYEFCIPADAAHRDAITAIDPRIACHGQSPGRIGCTEEQVLCIGDTHRPDHRKVLEAIARLPYVERIEQAWFE